MSVITLLIIKNICNYILFIFKLIIYCAIFALPLVLITNLLTKRYLVLRKKKSFVASLVFIIYPIVYILLLLIYFLPSIIYGFGEYSFIFVLQAIVFNFLKLLLVAIIVTLSIVVCAFITSAFYENFKKKHLQKNKKKKLQKNKYNFLLWASITSTNIIIFIIYLLFPRLLSLLVYLIYF
jgi:hypothetical protein